MQSCTHQALQQRHVHVDDECCVTVSGHVSTSSVNKALVGETRTYRNPSSTPICLQRLAVRSFSTHECWWPVPSTSWLR